MNRPQKTGHEKKVPLVRKLGTGGTFYMSGKKGMKHYPAEMKMEAVRLFYEEGKTRAEITQILGVRNLHRV